MLKKYQPERMDLLINTDWGIPLDGLTKEEARGKGLLLFQKRWVTKEERKRLKDEQGAYVSIRIIGFLLIFICVPVLINIRAIAAGGIPDVACAVVYAFVASVTGSGLIRYARFARWPAILIFLSFFILPFLPLFESEKGAPFLFILGAAGLYYLLRKTARKILWPQSGATTARRKLKSSVRLIIYGVVLLIGLAAGYFVYDQHQARQTAARACAEAKPGMPLADYLSKFSEADYKVIRKPDVIIIVPKEGLGRNHCIVAHDGRKITQAKTGFAD
ncbi:MAG: hypothetical protein EG826_16300 [Deltaproteobacteria bacterium]|nr:hypothetical protein [Deltaproteobacteria bacterium]